jgi:cytidine deaminase
MKPVDIACHLTEYENLEELSAEDRNLVIAAKESARNAYAPYSQFLVGAAVLLDNGNIVRGNNQENASYPIGLCAERVAIFSASANFPGIGFKTIAVTAFSDQFSINKPVPPCGACRQAIAEFEHLYGNQIRVIMTGESGKILIAETISALLPFQFNGDDLKTKKK